jgi:hypothetical protein
MKQLLNHKNMVEIVENTKIKAKDALNRYESRFNLKNRLKKAILRIEDNSLLRKWEDMIF